MPRQPPRRRAGAPRTRAASPGLLAPALALALAFSAASAPAALATARIWHTPVTLSEAGRTAEEPRVAMDAGGDAVAVWQRTNGANKITQAAARSAGGAPWQAPVSLSAAGENSEAPQIALDRAGDAVASWERFNGLSEIIQSATRPAGGSWGATSSLSEAGANAYYSEIGVDAAGDAVAVWMRFNGLNWIAQAAGRTASGSWQTPANLSEPGQSAYFPQVAVDGAGEAVAVWERFNGASYVIQAASRPASGAWSAPVTISASGENAVEPQVAIDSAGEALATWQRWNGADYVVQAAAHPAGGAWQSPANLSEAGQNADYPQIASDPAGASVVVWQRSNGANYIAQAASRPAGGAWQTAANLSEAGQSAEYPTVAIDGAGDAVAAWQRSNGANTIVQATNHPASGSWSAPASLSESGASASRPEAAMDSGGDALVVWQRSVAGVEVIQAAAYEPETAGLLTFTSAPALPTLGTVALSGRVQATTAAMTPFAIDDATGSGAGWNLTVEGQSGAGHSPVFRQYCPKSKCAAEAEGYAAGGYALAPDSLALNSTGAAFAAVGATGGAAPVLQCASGCDLDNGSAVKIASAAKGSGEGTWLASTFGPSSLVLTTPATLHTLPSEETYRVNLLWTLSTGP